MLTAQRDERLRRIRDILDSNHEALSKIPLSDRRFLYITTQQQLQKQSLRDSIQIIPQILSIAECESIVQWSHEYASIHGWSNNRHSSYATVDIGLLQGCRDSTSDEFNDDVCTQHTLFKSQLIQLLNERVIRRYLENSQMFVEGDLRILDAFVVQYEASNINSLPLHTDGSLISVNIALNENYDGGGTYFKDWNQTIQLKPGDCLMHWSKLLHSGQPITAGKRLILVAFVDTKDSFKLIK